jgi:hypothetical protein
MGLESLLVERKSAILDEWFNSILATYPAETASFLKRKKDRFANPVGSTILAAMQGLLDEILGGGCNPDNISKYLDNIIRIRAVQDFAPSSAVSFVFALKRVIREELAREPQDAALAEELLAFEGRIDQLSLLAFDVYSQCREKIYEIRVNEIKSASATLFRRATLVCKPPEQKPDKNDGNTDNATEAR